MEQTQGVAADIAVDRHFELVEHVKGTAVGTARAKDGWAGRQRARIDIRQGDMGGGGEQAGLDGSLAHQARVELAQQGEDGFAFHRQAQQAHALLDEGIELFDDDQAVY